MDILWTIVIGLVVGVIAKLLMPGRDPGGFINVKKDSAVKGDLNAFPDALNFGPFKIPLYFRGLFVHIIPDIGAGRSADGRPEDRAEQRASGSVADHSADDGSAGPADHSAPRGLVGLVPKRAVDGRQ